MKSHLCGVLYSDYCSLTAIVEAWLEGHTEEFQTVWQRNATNAFNFAVTILKNELSLV